MIDYPILVLAVSLVVLYLSEWVGAFYRKSQRSEEQADREDFTLILSATLTLLGLLIGFTFSMATSRYDQRKNYEEEEANAIGTEYLRAGLLSAPDAANVRALLERYLDQRVLFYETRDGRDLRKINAATARLENDLWSAVELPAHTAPTPVVPLAVSGMNDVLNARGYTQAAWWNRIPLAAWSLMVVIAIFCSLLIGYGMRRPSSKNKLLLVLPLVISISLFLISDIDSPRGGIIRLHPQNLVSLSQSLRTH